MRVRKEALLEVSIVVMFGVNWTWAAGAAMAEVEEAFFWEKLYIRLSTWAEVLGVSSGEGGVRGWELGTGVGGFLDDIVRAILLDIVFRLVL